MVDLSKSCLVEFFHIFVLFVFAGAQLILLLGLIERTVSRRSKFLHFCTFQLLLNSHLLLVIPWSW